jgi:YbbR domain-containing protein
MSPAAALSIWQLLARLRQQVRLYSPLAMSKQFFSNTGLVFVSALLALAAWSFVIEQTNPAQQLRIEAIPLRVMELPAGTTLVSAPPETVSAIIQTTANVRPTLRPASFQAAVSLQGLAAGLHHLPVQVNSAAGQVRVIAVDPPMLDLEVAEVITRSLPVTVDLPDQQGLSQAYQLVGAPVAAPDLVQITGAASLVEKVSRVQASILVANAAASIQEIRPLSALDETGRQVTGVSLEPAQVQGAG